MWNCENVELWKYENVEKIASLPPIVANWTILTLP